MKTLLTTTALVGAFAVAGVAHAGGAEGAEMGGVSVTVGGFADFQVGIQDQDLDTGLRSTGFQNDTEIHVNVEGSTESGLKYGAVIELEADVSQDDKDSTESNADKTYLFVESSVGRVEMGSNVGAEETLKVGAESIARASGGIDGDFYEYLPTSSTGQFVITPDLPLQHGLTFTDNGNTKESVEDVNKITYYTPRFSGFQAGVSYIPDTGVKGTSFGGLLGDAGTDYENVFALGANYEGAFSGVDVEAGVTYTTGENEAGANEDLSAWNAGVALGYEGFSVAGSFGDLGDLGTTAADDSADYWTLGAAYETGPYGVSVTYLDSTFDDATSDNNFSNVSVGADYQLAPGLVPYVEVSFFEFEDEGTPANDNDGSVFIIGTQLTF